MRACRDVKERNLFGSSSKCLDLECMAGLTLKRTTSRLSEKILGMVVGMQSS